MTFASLAAWALITLGTVYFFCVSSLFAPIRVAIAREGVLWESLIYCPMCSSYWIGAVFGLLHLHTFVEGLLMNALASGFAAMGWVFLVFNAVAHGVNPAWEAEASLRLPPTPEVSSDTSQTIQEDADE